MVELKTLKDIEKQLCFSGKEVRELGLRFSDIKKIEFIQKQRDEDITQEAIEWIKSCKCITNINSIDWQACDGCKRFIKFFNISKEKIL